MGFRLFLAILTGKIILFFTTRLRIGGGSAAPGLYALKIEPDIVRLLTSQIPQNIIVTGTNGKTTTARILSHFLMFSGKKVLRNSTGSNLERGIASTLIQKISLANTLTKQPLANLDVAIWELDEAAFNKAFLQIRPQTVVFLNAFRDQLDRYGEVDAVVGKWVKTLSECQFKTNVIINSGDPQLSPLLQIDNKKLNKFTFMVKNHQLMHEPGSANTSKIKSADFQAEILEVEGLSGVKVKVAKKGESQTIFFPVPGIYHIYDLLAAMGTISTLDIDWKNVSEALPTFSPAFGRVERVAFGQKNGYIFLIKNPAGATAVFETVQPELKDGSSMLLALNDNLADGTDISWIWDAQFEKLVPVSKNLKVVVSGNRAYDLALRLKYAGFDTDSIKIEPNLPRALAVAKDAASETVMILPTYTALLELQKHLAAKGIKKRYWEVEK